MMHQIIKPQVNNDDRPIRKTIIQKDEIVSLVIDINLLSVDGFIKKYCSSSSQESSIKGKIHSR